MIFLSDDLWEVRTTPNRGRGLFARKTIAKATLIGDYIGKVIHPRDAVVDENNFYLMYYHDLAAISPDLEKPGVHLLNHSCIPNCILYIYKGHTLAFALRDILKGEELTIRYLLAPKDDIDQSCEHVCQCNQTLCLKTMHLSKEKYAKWRAITDAQAKETKKERIRYGKDLKLLSSYPKISEDYIKKVNALFNPE
jgi:hypothetical protein